jgi:hypothetical protein
MNRSYNHIKHLVDTNKYVINSKVRQLHWTDDEKRDAN